MGGDVGDVALQPDQAPRAGQSGFVQTARVTGGLDESRGAGVFLAGDDRPGAVLLGRQRLAIARGPLGRVGPHRPPRPGMLVGVPDRHGTPRLVVLTTPTTATR